MNLEIGLIVFAALTLGLSVIALLVVWQEGRWSFVVFAIIGMVIVNALYPSARLAMQLFTGGDGILPEYLNPSLLTAKAYLVVVSTAFLLLGWHLSVRFCHSPNNGASSDDGTSQIPLVTACICLALAIIAYYAYTLAYGGFFGVFEFAHMIRSGIDPVSNDWSFLRPFGGLALFSAFLTFGILLVEPRRVAVWVLWLASLAVSIFILATWVGRLSFAIAGGSLLLGFLYSRPITLHAIHKVACLGVALAGLLYALYLAWGLIGRLEEGNITDFLIKELEFPHISFAVIQDANVKPRYFLDLIESPLMLLPSRLRPEFISASTRVTEEIIGGPKAGQLPLDFISFGYLQGGVAGVALIGLLAGIMLRLIDRVCTKVSHPGMRAIFYASLAINLPLVGIAYGDPEHLIARNFHFVVGGGIYLMVRTFWRLRKSAGKAGWGQNRLVGYSTGSSRLLIPKHAVREEGNATHTSAQN